MTPTFCSTVVNAAGYYDISRASREIEMVAETEKVVFLQQAMNGESPQ